MTPGLDVKQCKTILYHQCHNDPWLGCETILYHQCHNDPWPGCETMLYHQCHNDPWLGCETILYYQCHNDPWLGCETIFGKCTEKGACLSILYVRPLTDTRDETGIKTFFVS